MVAVGMSHININIVGSFPSLVLSGDHRRLHYSSIILNISRTGINNDRRHVFKTI